jgi:membrane associated rhomboid family serine protease
MKISYNAPVSLSFSFLTIGVLILAMFTGGQSTRLLFSVHSSMSVADPLAWLRLVFHVLGHADWEHLISNLAFLLLLGPILEEKYGSRAMMIMILITALITGVLNVLFFSTSLLGASGIVFMCILLASFANFKPGEIPLTFILIVAMYLAKEVLASLRTDNISQFAHIIGGTCGSLFGFLMPTNKGKR